MAEWLSHNLYIKSFITKIVVFFISYITKILLYFIIILFFYWNKKIYFFNLEFILPKILITSILCVIFIKIIEFKNKMITK